MMRSKSLTALFTIILFLGLQNLAFSQDVSIELGKTEIAINEPFQITARVQNDRIQEYAGFPDIPGLVKSGISSSNSTSIVNGHISSSEAVTQNYRPEKEGTYTLKPFTMKINGKTVKSSGVTIKVSSASRSYDPFEEMWGIGREQEDEEKFLDIKEDAFFAVTTNKNEVFLGEGFNMVIAFYIAEQNRAILDFYEVGEQLSEILKKVKPANCWEENFSIEEIVPEVVTINGKPYRQYKIYQANFYPLNTEAINIPSVPFKMIKFKISSTPSLFGRSHVKDFKVFASKEKTVSVKPLPPHPLKDQVAVGNYRLTENITSEKLSTGQSFNYQFQIVGEGNIAAIRKPQLSTVKAFDFYDPSEKSELNRSESTVFGSKQFNYMAIPNEPGSYNLGDYFQWIYFNPKTVEYDTLSSQYVVEVQGESKMNYAIDAHNPGGFYEAITDENNDLVSTNGNDLLKIITNASIVILLAATLFITIRKFS